MGREARVIRERQVSEDKVIFANAIELKAQVALHKRAEAAGLILPGPMIKHGDYEIIKLHDD